MTQTKATPLPYGETYGGAAPQNYERFFVPIIPRPLGQELVELAALKPGERVLDVACGTGIILRLVADRVGPSGSLAGLDLNPAMLAMARSLMASSGAPVRWYESSAESMPLPDASFDVAFCQLGLQFVVDREAALKEVRRVLAPNGRFLFNVPRPSKFFDVLDAAVERHIGPSAAQFVRGVFSMNDPSAIEALVERAGFHDVVVRTEKKGSHGPDAKSLLWQYVYSTPLSAELPKVDASAHAALEQEVVENWKPWMDKDGLTYEQEMILVKARK